MMSVAPIKSLGLARRWGSRGNDARSRVTSKKAARSRLGYRTIEIRADLGADWEARRRHGPKISDRIKNVIHLKVAPKVNQPTPSLVRPTADQPGPHQGSANRAARRPTQGNEVIALMKLGCQQRAQHTGRKRSMASSSLAGYRDFGSQRHEETQPSGSPYVTATVAAVPRRRPDQNPFTQFDEPARGRIAIRMSSLVVRAVKDIPRSNRGQIIEKARSWRIDAIDLRREAKQRVRQVGIIAVHGGPLLANRRVMGQCRLALSDDEQCRTCETAGSIDYVVSKEFFHWHAYCVQAFADAAGTNVIAGRNRNVSAMPPALRPVSLLQDVPIAEEVVEPRLHRRFCRGCSRADPNAAIGPTRTAPGCSQTNCHCGGGLGCTRVQARSRAQRCCNKIGAFKLALFARESGPPTAQALANVPSVAHPPPAPTGFERALTVNGRGLLIVNVPEVVPFWLNGGDAFVYRRTTHGEHRFILVDVATGVRLAVDQAHCCGAK